MKSFGRNMMDLIVEIIRRDQDEQIFRAVCTALDGDLVQIIRTGQTNPDEQYYPSLNGASGILVTDEVVVARLGKGFIVLGTVERTPGG